MSFIHEDKKKNLRLSLSVFQLASKDKTIPRCIKSNCIFTIKGKKTKLLDEIKVGVNPAGQRVAPPPHSNERRPVNNPFASMEPTPPIPQIPCGLLLLKLVL
jgi:hypothetical protein